VHHFHSTARQTERHGPEGTLAGPVDEIVDARDRIFNFIIHWDAPGACKNLFYSLEARNLQVLIDGRYGVSTQNECSKCKYQRQRISLTADVVDETLSLMLRQTILLVPTPL
jgi:hypothetical protein